MKRIMLLCLAVCLCAPASARADGGSITGITRLSDDEFQAGYSVYVSEPTSTGYYGGYGYAWQVGASEACDPYDYEGRLTWVGEVMSSDTPGADTGTDTFSANSPSFKLCLGINRASLGRRTVAEQVYSAPAPTPTPPSAPAPAPAPAPGPAPSSDGAAQRACTYWMGQEAKRERRFRSARSAYRRSRTAARRRQMNVARAKLRTAERKAQEACG